MNFLKLIQSPEATSFFNATVSTIQRMTTRATPQRDRFPAELVKSQMESVLKQHSEQWQTVEMKDGGYAFVFVPNNLIAFYSPQLSDLDIMKLFYDEFVEISMRQDCVPIINKIVELIVQNPDRDPLYYATAAGLTGYVGRRLTGAKDRVLNESLTENDDTPAHVAALHNQDIIGFFLREGFDPLKKAKNGETIAHYGAKHVNVLKAIRENISGQTNYLKLITTENNSKQTALHTALIKKDCMEYLLQYCPQAFSQSFTLPLVSVIEDGSIEDDAYMKQLCEKLKMFDPDFLVKTNPTTSETILHSAIPTKTLKILLSYCEEKHLEAKGSTGRTPLHAAVKRDDCEGILALISYGANVNSVDNAGLPPVHFAVENRNLKSVKALMLFNADVTKINSLAATREIREALNCGSKEYYGREPRSFEFDPQSVDHIALKNTINQLEKFSMSKFFNSLAFDGGGMRGLVSLQILREIENRYKGRENLLESFKSLGGTSTGSILIMAIAKYQNLDKVTRLYLRLKDDIFSGSRPYDGDFLEKRLTEELGNVTLSQFGKEKEIRMAVTVTRVDVRPPKLAVFRSFAIPKNIKDDRFTPLEDWPAAKIARCSSAAPTYFPAVNNKYMDGGIIANNPSCEILCDQQTISLLLPNFDWKMKIMVSIGTGQPPQIRSDHVDLALPGNISEVFSSINSVFHMSNVFLDQLTSADGVIVDRAKLMASAMGVAFFRFSPPLSQNYGLDEIRAEQLIDMMWETKVYMNTRLNDINILLSLLEKSAPLNNFRLPDRA